MKRSFLFWPLAVLLLLFTCTLSAQEEYPNEGMPIRDLDGNVYRIIMTESGVWMAENLKTFKLNDGTTHWKAPNEGATNEIFFTALPAGEVSYFYTDAEPGTRTTWWTSTEDRLNLEPGEKAANANIVGLSYNFHSKTMGTYQKESALPVRCKMDDE